MVIELVVLMSVILQKLLCTDDRTYLIEQSNVRGTKLGEEVHWTLHFNESYIIDSVRINVTFVDNQMFWMKVNDKNVSKICNQLFTEENGWIVIKCNKNLVIGRQLTIATSFNNSDLINYNLLIDICSISSYPLIDSNIAMDSSLDDENNNTVYYENDSCILINKWSNYTWWIVIDIKEEVFVESFTFSGNESEFKNVDIDKSVKAQINSQKTVNFIENETLCQLGSNSTFICNKTGTYILVKGIATRSTRYLICQAHIFGFKAREVLKNRHGKCNFKILENIHETKLKKITSNKFWMISLAVLSSILILLCLAALGILRMKLLIWSRTDDRNLMHLLQRNDWQNPLNKFILNPELENEFLKLPNGFIRSSNIGRKPLNLIKNRFQNVIPFDENLVKLEDQSDYINASFIRGFDGSPRVYIATQGPKANTLNDFWKLVWQYKVDIIVMLMRMVENNCEQYWPGCNQHEATFGNISVSIVKEYQFADYVRRHFVVKKSNTNEMARSVVHMQFLSWKDMSAPNHCFPLLDFRQKVNSFQMYSKSPLLVHCSAGVGRTGTYIAIDCLIKQAETAGEVSIYKCVKNLRFQRMSMVQNKDQCIFIFKAISEAGMLSDTGTNCIDFMKKFSGSLNQSSRTTQRFTQECNQSFEILMKTTQIDREEACSRQKVKGRNLDCDGQIFQAVSGANHFNASSIQCFKKSNAHILSQIPVPGFNFWQILLENEVDQVLLLEDKCEPYWPGYNPIAIDGMKIHLQGEDRSNKYCVIRNFSVVDEKDNDPQALNHKEVTQYHLTKLLWSEHSQVPANKNKFQMILKQLVKSNKRIILQCLNGSERCVLTAAAMLMIDMILLDEVVDPFLACRYVLASRPDAIFTKEQFQFMYHLALEYIQDCGKYTFMNSSNNLNVISDGSALSDYGIYHVLREY